MPCGYAPEITTATIHSCRWEDSLLRAPSSLFVSHFIVTFSYGVDGIHHKGEFYSSNEWKEGTEMCGLYNPQNPEGNRVCDDGRRF